MHDAKDVLLSHSADAEAACIAWLTKHLELQALHALAVEPPGIYAQYVDPRNVDMLCRMLTCAKDGVRLSRQDGDGDGKGSCVHE